MSRRRFLAVAGTAAAGAAALAADGCGTSPRNALDVTTHGVASPGDGGRITFVQITDLHLHAVGWLHRRIAAEVRRARPDFVVFTGDSIDRADRLRNSRPRSRPTTASVCERRSSSGRL